MNVPLTCPCGRHQEVPIALAGTMTACVGCGNPLAVPALGVPAQPPATRTSITRSVHRGRPTQRTAVARPSCGFCFRALDPDDPADGRRRAVRCQRCGRLFHAACWAQCTKPECGHDQCEPAEVAPPPRLADHVLCTVPVFGAPVCTMENMPLGLSTGMLQDDGVNRLRVRNNSDKPVHISIWIGPPWLSWRWEPVGELSDSAIPVADDDQLEPGQTRTMELCFHGMRPPSRRVPLRFGEQRVELRTDSPSNSAFGVRMVGFLLLLGFHLCMTARVFADPNRGLNTAGLSFAVLLGYTALVAPAPYRKLSRWVVRVVFGPLDAWQFEANHATRPVAWLDNALAGAEFEAPLGRQVHRFILCLGVMPLGFSAFYLAGLAGSAVAMPLTRHWTGIVLLCAGYAVVQLGAWSYWLWAYGVDLRKEIPWIVDSMANLIVRLVVWCGRKIDAVVAGIRGTPGRRTTP